MANIDKTKVQVKDTRISKLRLYLMSIIDKLLTDKSYQINANMLSADPINYSLDKIPTASKIHTDIIGNTTYRDVYSFRSRNKYSIDTLNNLINIGFFEIFEKNIRDNNNKGILPDIEGIEEIECLNCGSCVTANSTTAEFDIQIQIIYKGE